MVGGHAAVGVGVDPDPNFIPSTLTLTLVLTVALTEPTCNVSILTEIHYIFIISHLFVGGHRPAGAGVDPNPGNPDPEAGPNPGNPNPDTGPNPDTSPNPDTTSNLCLATCSAWC